MNRILFLGAPQTGSAIQRAATSRRIKFTLVSGLQAATKALARQAFDLALVEMDPSSARFIKLYEYIQHLSQILPVWVLVPSADNELILACRQFGAADVITAGASEHETVVARIEKALTAADSPGTTRLTDSADGQVIKNRAPIASPTTPARSSHLCSFEISSDLRTWHCSDEIYSILERDPQKDSLTFTTFLRSLHPTDRKEIRALLLGAVQTGIPFQMEARILPGGGREKVIQIAGRPVLDETRQGSSILGLLADISHYKTIEQALRASEVRYQGLFENAPIVISEQDFSGIKTYLDQLRSQVQITDIRSYLKAHPQTVTDCLALLRISDINQAGLELFHAPGKKEILDNPGLVIREEGYLLFEEELVRIFNGEQHFVLEGINYTLDGLPIDIQLRWIAGAGGKTDLTHVIIAITDISERNKMTRELVKSEKKFRSIFQQSLDGVVITDNQGVIHEWNQGMERISGLNRADVIGKFIWEIYYQQMMDEDRLKTTLEQEKTRILDYLTNAEDPWFGKVIEHPLQKPDGTRRRIHSIYFPIETGGEHMIVNISRDVTDYLEAHQRLDLAQERFQLVSENISDLVLLINTSGMISYASPSVKGTLGYNPQEMIGRNVAEFITAEDAEKVLDYFYPRILQDPHLERLEFRAVHKEGKFIWLETGVQPICNADGSADFLVASSRDVTERKQSEHDLQAAQKQLANRIAELELLTQELNLLTELTNMLQICATPEEAITVISQSASDLFPGVTGVFYTATGDDSAMKASAYWGSFKGMRSVDQKDCWGLRRNRIHTTYKNRSSLFCAHIGLPEPSSSICIPVVSSGHTIALLSLQTEHEAPGLTLAQQKLAAATAEQIGLALSNLYLRQNLREMAIRDSLTGLYNRHYLEETLETELNRAQRSGKPIGLIMLDLDGLKELNSRYGHPAVDHLLRDFGIMLKASVRSGDIACRYGGDEFLLILPETSLSVAEQRAEQIRQQIKTLSIDSPKSPPHFASASIGVACWPQHGTTSRLVLNAVDAALFTAKEAGGDQVKTTG